MTFNEFDLSKNIKKALQDINYETPSPIQEQAIPVLLEGKDVLGCAQTGTGKTCAFMVPILNKILTTNKTYKIRSLILTPTRELAIQIYESTLAYSKYTNIKSLAIFGGVKEGMQKQRLAQGVDVLIATPGRLLDFINQGVVNIKNIEFFVLDEADRMLDMGFIKDVNKVINLLPKKRQTLLFSATMPESIVEICNRILTNPIKITVTPPNTTVEKIKQSVYLVDKINKLNLLVDVIVDNKMFSVLVFSRTKHGANKICEYLVKTGIKAAAIHGNKSQNARQQALNDFKKNKIQVLVATDIVSRGIDIDYLSNVINFDAPEDSETYVHRIGRTARAGREGEATSFICFDELDILKQIKKDCKVDLVEMKHNYPMKLLFKSEKKQQNNRKKSNNNSKRNVDIKRNNKK